MSEWVDRGVDARVVEWVGEFNLIEFDSIQFYSIQFYSALYSATWYQEFE